MATTRPGSDFIADVVVPESVAVVTVDEDERVVFANDRAHDLFGSEVDSRSSRAGTLETVSEDCIVEPESEDCIVEPVANVLDRLRAQSADVESVDGTVLHETLDCLDGESAPVTVVVDATTHEGTQYYTFRLFEGKPDAIASSSPSQPDRHDRTAFVELSRELAASETISSVAETALTALTDLLGTDVGCVRVFDGETNALDRVATTERAEQLVETQPAFDLHATLAGRAYRRGETVVDDPDTDGVRASLHVPLGETAVMTALAPPDEGWSEPTIEVATDVAAVVTANLERVVRGQQHGPTDGAGAPGPTDGAGAPGPTDGAGAPGPTDGAGGIKADHPTPPTQSTPPTPPTAVTDLLETVLDRLPDAESRPAVERRLCSTIVGTERYTGAWVVETAVDGTPDVETAAGAVADGTDDGVPDALERVVGDALADQEVTAGYVRRTDASDDAADRVAGVPLIHGDRVYGVLVVSTDSDDGFDDRIRSELSALGIVAGFAFHVVEQRELLLSDEIVELELAVTDDGCFAVALSAALDTSVEIERSLLTSDRDHLFYVEVDGVNGTRACEAARAIDGVTASRVIADYEDGCTIEVVKTFSGADAMLEVGATMRRATAENGHGTLVVEIPAGTDVRSVVDHYQSINPEAELIAKREIDRPARSARKCRELVERRLTDKQRNVIEAAYSAGYYDWPRKSTAEEVAETFGVAPATFHQHVRKAEQTLLATFLDEE